MASSTRVSGGSPREASASTWVNRPTGLSSSVTTRPPTLVCASRAMAPSRVWPTSMLSTSGVMMVDSAPGMRASMTAIITSRVDSTPTGRPSSTHEDAVDVARQHGPRGLGHGGPWAHRTTGYDMASATHAAGSSSSGRSMRFHARTRPRRSRSMREITPAALPSRPTTSSDDLRCLASRASAALTSSSAGMVTTGWVM